MLFSNLKHGGPWRKKESVHLYVSCRRKTCGSFQTDNTGVLELTERRRHCSAENRKKKLTEKTPSKKENNKLRKFKVLRHGNTGDKLASQKPAKTVTLAFSFDCTKCGQVWTSNVVYLRAVKVSFTKG